MPPSICLMSNPSRFQRNRVHMAAIIRLFAMHRAAVAVKALVGIGIGADVIDHQDAGVLEPHPDEAGEVEHRMALARRWQEEHGIVGLGVDKTLDEFCADLVALL